MNQDSPPARIGMLLHRLDDRAVSGLVVALCRELSALGAQPVVISMDQASRAQDAGPDTEVVEVAAGVRRTSAAVLPLARRLRRLRLDVLFAHLNGPARAALLARRLARLDLPVVPVEHVHYRSFYRSRHRLQDPLTRWLYARADRVAGVSPGVLDELASVFPEVAPRGVLLPATGPAETDLARAADPLPHSWFEDEDGGRPRVISSVANLVPRKGQDTIVRALPAIRAAVGDVRLALVGRPDDVAFARTLNRLAEDLGVREHLWLAGYRSDALSFIRHADVFVLASHTEGCPRVLIEAMASGTPVVATDCPIGPRFLLDDGRYGQLVPVGDVDGLAGAVVAALSDRMWHEEVPDGALRRAAEFSPANVARRYLDLTRQLTAADTTTRGL